jgi:adenylate cyclase
VAEYKQVTLLFADVAHLMDIAKAVGAEQLREIMAGLVDAAATVVKRYGRTVDKFTGDGVTAIFGAALALDHAPSGVSSRAGHSGEMGRLAVC